MKSWLKDVRLFVNAWTSLLLIGNKTDQPRVVSQEEAKKFADAEELLYIETSAKTGQGISDAFVKITQNMMLRQ